MVCQRYISQMYLLDGSSHQLARLLTNWLGNWPTSLPHSGIRPAHSSGSPHTLSKPSKRSPYNMKKSLWAMTWRTSSLQYWSKKRFHWSRTARWFLGWLDLNDTKHHLSSHKDMHGINLLWVWGRNVQADGWSSNGIPTVTSISRPVYAIWPHGREALERFLVHINSLSNSIKFTMETESPF